MLPVGFKNIYITESCFSCIDTEIGETTFRGWEVVGIFDIQLDEHKTG